MCGVFAVAALEADARALPPAVLDRALDVLRPRGPDGSGSYLSPGGDLAVAHTRLAVRDPERGVQPFRDPGRGLASAVNGEFYDVETVRDELAARGFNFVSRSDSEILLPLYARHGTDCLRHLRGEFAFVIIDEKRRHLFAARDRFGVKPLCYALHGGRLYLASEAKALFAAGVPCRWDREAFYHAATHQYLPPGRTLFAGVHALRPGEYLLYAGGRLRLETYWDLDYPRERESSHADPREAIALFREHLEESVRLRMRASVPVACHLSGGLDSSAILALARRHCARPPACFSIRFENEDGHGADGYDESEHAAELARRLGASLEFVPVRPVDILENLDAAAVHAEGLAINGQLTAKYLLNQAIHRAGFRVALSGEGSDEILAGYAHLQTDLARTLRAPEAALADIAGRNPAQLGVMLPLGDGLPLEAVRRRLGAVPAFFEAKASLGLRMLGVLNEDYLAEFAGFSSYDKLLDSFDIKGRLHGRHPVDRAAYLWTRLALAGYILRTLGDGTETAHGVEGRPPFLDHVLFEYTRGLPLSLRAGTEAGGLEKALLRAALADVLPAVNLRRPKRPLLAPPLSLFAEAKTRSRLRERLAEAGGTPFFDADRLRARFDALEDESVPARAALEPVFMTALCAGAIQRHYRPEN